MPPRLNPTLRQRRIGAELRKMREAAGLSTTKLSRALGIDRTQVSQMESAKVGVSPERLRSFAAACKCMNLPLIEALESMLQDRSKGWWEEYRGTLPDGFLENAELEKTSHELMIWVLTHMPGPSQTISYASAVFGRVIPPIPRHELEARIAFRMQRKADLRRNPKPLTAFIYESVLWTRFGGTQVLKDQLATLLEDSELPWMTIRVVPFDIETFPGAAENLTYAFGAIPDLDTVEQESSQGPEYLDAVSELTSYRRIFDRTEAAALSEVESRDLIRKIARNL
ncbi:transcriptional regulator with XRE-family HTH domain [Kitasatospora sp. MAA19]|uniref:helix-turn-helix domain-containing protein n=1 Tax=Kitasatospora sp. MAA19 TaxID=3035090 RepID=UPI002474C25A|nr:helix-turn-helix transcriptional regulator [Kitasatospora sp. MAA19]MDH6704206.1 transcriptional regulator with XRE-family HTH domain [Kitasatospora sp. MAA19]